MAETLATTFPRHKIPCVTSLAACFRELLESYFFAIVVTIFLYSVQGMSATKVVANSVSKERKKALTDTHVFFADDFFDFLF
jgi:hypothetical protein